MLFIILQYVGVVTDLSLVSNAAWQVAKRRAEIIRPLAAMTQCSHAMIVAASVELDLSERHVYTLVRRCRLSDGKMDSLVPNVSGGGRGSQRIGRDREALLQTIIQEIYLTSQRLTPEAVVREVRRRCQVAGLMPPSGNTIRRRLASLSPEAKDKRRKSAIRPAAIHGSTPAARYPLDTIQMDHTKVDIILVDPSERKPIGRPWITVAIDVFSRCIVGIHLSLEAPSATSVGLCLVHAASDKSSWLAEREISATWPVHGKPRRISVDNGAEFHSAAFERGCEQHGIDIHWRPPGQPHFGGIVERVIGTLMQLVHELPGTTFSNPMERGEYDSDRMACLTLEELEHWMAVAITGIYHQRPHRGLGGESPLSRYQQGMAERMSAGDLPSTIKNPRAFLIDFLPIFRRSIQRNGITIDHITYFSPALRPWITRCDSQTSVLVRRDPRDISRIYLFDQDSEEYLEVPYRDLSRPSVTAWEHRLAVRRHRELRQTEIDETSLFRAVIELRAIEHKAATSTRTARRNQTRRQSQETLAIRNAAPAANESGQMPQPFSEIEAW